MDEKILLYINNHHSPFLDSFMLMISQKELGIPLFLPLAYVLWRNFGTRNTIFIIASILVGIFFTDCINAQYIRPAIGRIRPSNPDSPIFNLLHSVSDYSLSGGGGRYSFPSAHSANLWLLTFIILYYLRGYLLCTSLLFFVGVNCYSRLYLGVHYPSDILGGFIFALAVSSILLWIMKKKIAIAPIKHPSLVWLPSLYIWSVAGVITLLSLL